VLHGTHEERDNDPRIGSMPELREGPFAKYSSYQLLSRVRLPAQAARQAPAQAPERRLLEARLERSWPTAAHGSSPASTRPDAKDFFPCSR